MLELIPSGDMFDKYKIALTNPAIYDPEFAKFAPEFGKYSRKNKQNKLLFTIDDFIKEETPYNSYHITLHKKFSQTYHYPEFDVQMVGKEVFDIDGLFNKPDILNTQFGRLRFINNTLRAANADYSLNTGYYLSLEEAYFYGLLIKKRWDFEEVDEDDLNSLAIDQDLSSFEDFIGIIPLKLKQHPAHLEVLGSILHEIETRKYPNIRIVCSEV